MTKPVITPEQREKIQYIVDVWSDKYPPDATFVEVMLKLDEQGVDFAAILKEEYDINIYSDD